MTLIYSFFRGTRWLVRVALCFLLFAPVALTIASSILKAYAVGAG